MKRIHYHPKLLGRNGYHTFKNDRQKASIRLCQLQKSMKKFHAEGLDGWFLHPNTDFCLLGQGMRDVSGTPRGSISMLTHGDDPKSLQFKMHAYAWFGLIAP